MQALRQSFLEAQPAIPAHRTFFIDETGSTTEMARIHARAPVGKRVSDHKPRNYGDIITIIGALSAKGLSALMTVRGGTTKDVFAAYVEHVLAPELAPGDVVVLDNLAGHKDPRVRTLVEGKGARLLFLPPYSPEFNPIELAWAWVKQWLKTCRCRSEEAIHKALVLATDLVTPESAERWIRHCGYSAQST